MSYNDWLSRRRRYTPERIAIVDDVSGRQYTFAELDSRAAALAEFLKASFQIGPGDRIAFLSTNRVEVIDLFFACGKLGAVLVPLNYRLPAAAIVELLEDCRPKLFVYESNFAEIVEVARTGAATPRELPMDDAAGAVKTSIASVLEHSSQTGRPEPSHSADLNEVAMILYTSGTTGRAKGAMITWQQIHWNALNTIIGLQLTENDTAFLNMPLYHTGGWHVLFTPLMLLGGRIILQKRFDAERVNNRVGPEGVTILFGVPTMLRMMADSPNFSEADFSKVRFAICGGEPCPLPVIDCYQARGVAIRQGYGLTEAGPNCYSLPAEDAVRKQGSIGFPNFFIGARLIKEDGSEAGDGEVGELWMKGPHVFGGYWGHEVETAAALRDGWLGTGDLMQRDGEGYYYVVGRKKDMYVSGGENVYPAQVERILQSHAAIDAAAVIGVPDAKWGETGWAFIQPTESSSPTESDVLAWCRQYLATFQCPTKVVFMKALPVGHSGKIDKLALRRQADELTDTP